MEQKTFNRQIQLAVLAPVAAIAFALPQHAAAGGERAGSLSDRTLAICAEPTGASATAM